MTQPIGHLPVSTWRISQGNRCDFCLGFIDEGFPYLEDDYAEECQDYCIPCAVKSNRNLVSNQVKVIQEDWVCPECYANVRCDCE